METNGVPEPFFWCDSCMVTVVGDCCSSCHVGVCEACGIPMVDGEQTRAGMVHSTCTPAGAGWSILDHTPPQGRLLVHPRAGRRRRRSGWQEITVACWAMLSVLVAAYGLGLLIHFLRRGGP